MKLESTLQVTKSNRNVNIPSAFIKNLDWGHKEKLVVEMVGNKIIITKKGE